MARLQVGEPGVAAGEGVAQAFVELLLFLYVLDGGGGALLDHPHTPHRDTHALPEGVVTEHRELGVVRGLGRFLFAFLAGAAGLEFREACPDE